MKDRKPSRYTTAKGLEAQTEPGSRGRVLKNLLGIRSKHQIDMAEYRALAEVQVSYLERITPETRFTAAVIRGMHKDWLGQIYDWAGRYRTVELSKAGFRWPPAYLVESNMDAFEKGLLACHTPCRPAPIAEVAQRLAQVHADLLLIHPFREGNGRLARWVADLMAQQAEFPSLDYRLSGKGARKRREAYISAVLAGYSQHYEPLASLFREALERSLRAEDK